VKHRAHCEVRRSESPNVMESPLTLDKYFVVCSAVIHDWKKCGRRLVDVKRTRIFWLENADKVANCCEKRWFIRRCQKLRWHGASSWFSYMSHPLHPTWCDNPNTIWRRESITKPLGRLLTRAGSWQTLHILLTNALSPVKMSRAKRQIFTKFKVPGNRTRDLCVCSLQR
jgi:hypothetical protein